MPKSNFDWDRFQKFERFEKLLQESVLVEDAPKTRPSSAVQSSAESKDDTLRGEDGKEILNEEGTSVPRKKTLLSKVVYCTETCKTKLTKESLCTFVKHMVARTLAAKNSMSQLVTKLKESEEVMPPAAESKTQTAIMPSPIIQQALILKEMELNDEEKLQLNDNVREITQTYSLETIDGNNGANEKLRNECKNMMTTLKGQFEEKIAKTSIPKGKRKSIRDAYAMIEVNQALNSAINVGQAAKEDTMLAILAQNSYIDKTTSEPNDVEMIRAAEGTTDLLVDYFGLQVEAKTKLTVMKITLNTLAHMSGWKKVVDCVQMLLGTTSLLDVSLSYLTSAATIITGFCSYFLLKKHLQKIQQNGIYTIADIIHSLWTHAFCSMTIYNFLFVYFESSNVYMSMDSDFGKFGRFIFQPILMLVMNAVLKPLVQGKWLSFRNSVTTRINRLREKAKQILKQLKNTLDPEKKQIAIRNLSNVLQDITDNAYKKSLMNADRKSKSLQQLCFSFVDSTTTFAERVLIGEVIRPSSDRNSLKTTLLSFGVAVTFQALQCCMPKNVSEMTAIFRKGFWNWNFTSLFLSKFEGSTCTFTSRRIFIRENLNEQIPQTTISVEDLTSLINMRINSPTDESTTLSDDNILDSRNSNEINVLASVKETLENALKKQSNSYSTGVGNMQVKILFQAKGLVQQILSVFDFPSITGNLNLGKYVNNYVKILWTEGTTRPIEVELSYDMQRTITHFYNIELKYRQSPQYLGDIADTNANFFEQDIFQTLYESFSNRSITEQVSNVRQIEYTLSEANQLKHDLTYKLAEPQYVEALLKKSETLPYKFVDFLKSLFSESESSFFSGENVAKITKTLNSKINTATTVKDTLETLDSLNTTKNDFSTFFKNRIIGDTSADKYIKLKKFMQVLPSLPQWWEEPALVGALNDVETHMGGVGYKIGPLAKKYFDENLNDADAMEEKQFLYEFYHNTKAGFEIQKVRALPINFTETSFFNDTLNSTNNSLFPNATLFDMIYGPLSDKFNFGPDQISPSEFLDRNDTERQRVENATKQNEPLTFGEEPPPVNDASEGFWSFLLPSASLEGLNGFTLLSEVAERPPRIDYTTFARVKVSYDMHNEGKKQHGMQQCTH